MTGMYSVAKARGDEAGMERAMGYASQYRDKAMVAKERTGEALIESAKEARLEEKLEQEQCLEEKRVEKQSEAEGIQAANDTTTTSAENAQQPAYILDLSQEYLQYAQAGTATETDSTASVMPAAKPAVAANFPGLKGVVYSPSIPTDFSHVKVAAASLNCNVGVSLDLLI